VPWLEGYTLRGCGAQQLPQGQRQQQVQQELLPLDLTLAAPAVATTVSKCGFVGGSDGVRPKKRMTVDVVKFKRLDVSTVLASPPPFHWIVDYFCHLTVMIRTDRIECSASGVWAHCKSLASHHHINADYRTIHDRVAQV
jgi:hypothetical protein